MCAVRGFEEIGNIVLLLVWMALMLARSAMFSLPSSRFRVCCVVRREPKKICNISVIIYYMESIINFCNFCFQRGKELSNIFNMVTYYSPALTVHM